MVVLGSMDEWSYLSGVLGSPEVVKRVFGDEVVVSEHVVVTETPVVGEVVGGDGQTRRQTQALPVHA